MGLSYRHNTFENPLIETLCHLQRLSVHIWQHSRASPWQTEESCWPTCSSPIQPLILDTALEIKGEDFDSLPFTSKSTALSYAFFQLVLKFKLQRWHIGLTGRLRYGPQNIMLHFFYPSAVRILSFDKGNLSLHKYCYNTIYRSCVICTYICGFECSFDGFEGSGPADVIKRVCRNMRWSHEQGSRGQ